MATTAAFSGLRSIGLASTERIEASPWSLNFASESPPACPQHLEQPGVSRFDLKSPRERGTRHLAYALQDPRVLVVCRV